MEPVVAVYDACVLHPYFLRDFLMWLAVHGRTRDVFRAKWTGRIHREWIQSVLGRWPQLSRAALLRTRRLMDANVLGARVYGYQRWERRLTLPDVNDRHVLAAAVVCAADVIVTFNTRHFPASILAPFFITAATPDTFACQIYDSGIVVSAAADHRASLKRPPLTPAEYLDHLRNNGLPGAADLLSRDPI